MPNRTLYVRDEDTAVWDRAEQAAENARQSVSQLVATALRHYLPTIHTPGDQLSDIRVRTGTGSDHFDATMEDYGQVESFTGRWLVPPGDEAASGATRHTTGLYYAVALTRRGQIAVYSYHPQGRGPAKLEAFPVLEEAGLPGDIEVKAAAALGQPTVRLRDI
jgi:hypothetical protein